MTRRRRTAAEQPALLELPNSAETEFLRGIDAAGAGLLDEDLLAVEMEASALLSAAHEQADNSDQIDAMFRRLGEHHTRQCLALLVAVQSVAEGSTRVVIDGAVERLVAAGVPRPRWADEITAPLVPGRFWLLDDPDGEEAVVTGTFHRARSSHVVVVVVDETDCGAASLVGLAPGADLTAVTSQLPEATHHPLDAAWFRWHVESAMSIRSDHDTEDESLSPGRGFGRDEQKVAAYDAMSWLVRRRLASLPTLDRPLRRHADIIDITQRPARPEPSPRLADSVYQLKVTLRGSKPPIWRRLEAPGDITLGRLHRVIQIAFGWLDDHLHAFDTPAGRFGPADAGLDFEAFQDEQDAVLAQVAGAKTKFAYTYDFGDDWRHDIVVEKILDRDPETTYPRCTSGRRAAPPDDCGGLWGYHRLLTILVDPTHPEYEEAAEWFADPAAFNPETFDPDPVSQKLAGLQKTAAAPGAEPAARIVFRTGGR